MKSIQIRGPYDVAIVDEDRPHAGPGELVVEARISGISSGTEMFLYRGTYPNFKLKKWAQWKEYPVYPGYELVGTVAEVGSATTGGARSGSVASLQPGAGVVMADTSEFKTGDRVVCLGAHQQFARVPATLAAKIPDEVTDEQATLAVLATTTMHSTRRLSLEYGDTVAIIGMGVVGNLALQHARLGGASKTIAIDLDAKRLEFAKKVGADFLIDASKGDAHTAVLDYTHGIGADAVVEASGARGTLQLAIDCMRDRGTVELLGWRTDESSFTFGDLYYKEGKIIATRAIGPDPGLPYSYVRWGYDQSLRLAVELIVEGKLKADFFVPERYDYREIKKVYEKIDKNPARIGMQGILTWQ
jgi:2-desacetyl-2-hydroxyethyl bacteriochlorophyllide A dehydrogenase